MARVFRCADAGLECDYVARGETDDEVMQNVARHADEVHGMKQVPDDVARQIRSGIRSE